LIVTSISSSSKSSSKLSSSSSSSSLISFKRGTTIKYTRLYSTINDSINDDDIEFTRSAFVRIIDDSWNKVTMLVPSSTLKICEKELKDATSLLVLATLRYSASQSPKSRETVEQMFQRADVNHDGQLTFSEWYDWLGKAPSITDTKKVNDYNRNIDDNIYKDNGGINGRCTPTIAILNQVLSHAIHSLRVISRIESAEPYMLSAAFIAGGTMAGGMDADVCKTMLSRLSDKTRELVTIALTLESASAPQVTKRSTSIFDVAALPSPSKSKKSDSSVSSVLGTIRNKVNPNNEIMNRQPSVRDVIQTVDLSSIPLVTAPPIDNADQELSSLMILDRINGITDDDLDEIDSNELGFTLNTEEKLVDKVDSPLSLSFGLSRQQNDNEEVTTDQVDLMLSQVSKVMDDVMAIRTTLRDLDDAQARMMRSLFVHKSGSRKDVLGLTMALRATRLQHAGRLPPALRQQLAVETLQIWAPLSFEIGISSYTPELEVQSYVLLFPRSFGSFISWYGAFRPMAKRLLKELRTEIEQNLKADDVLPVISSKITIQSRIKAAPSAFKKMIKTARNQNQVHDLLGMRIVVQSKLPNVIAMEKEAVWRTYGVVLNCSTSWQNIESRFKDYVTYPKLSGYESLHLTLVHKLTGFQMELQIRSSSMHYTAEYGKASHQNYKALLLPESTSPNDNNDKNDNNENT